MAYGLEVFDTSVVKKLSTSDRLTKLHSIYVATGESVGSNETFVAVSGMVDDGTWIVQGDGSFTIARVASGGFYYVTPGLFGSISVPFLIFRV